MNMQGEIQRQADMIRTMEEPPEPPFSGSRQYFSNLTLDNAPVSPRQMAHDDLRRGPPMGGARNNPYRPPVPSHLSLTPRRYGSIGTGQSSPGSLRPQFPPPPPPPHPLSAVSTSPSNSLARRHTSADIRIPQGWPNQNNPSPFASGQSSAVYPSSPKRGPLATTEDQRIRDSFSSYSLAGASQSRNGNSRPSTPPFSNGNAADHLNSWSWGTGRDKGQGSIFNNNSGPPTRRGSMAHILNPAETAEREEEHEEEMREEDRKRKRVQ
jgi:hypothetical protein